MPAAQERSVKFGSAQRISIHQLRTNVEVLLQGGESHQYVPTEFPQLIKQKRSQAESSASHNVHIIDSLDWNRSPVLFMAAYQMRLSNDQI